MKENLYLYMGFRSSWI